MLGLIMVFSSSYIYAKETFGSSTYFFFRQSFFIAAGLLVALIVGISKINFWINYGRYLNIVAILLLLLTFFPGIGVVVKGSHRWINILGLTVQPGEIIKFTTMLAALFYFENFSILERKEKIKQGIFLIAPLVVLIKQPDYGTFLICFTVIGFVCFMSSFSRKYFYIFLASGITIGAAALFIESYRIKRILTFLDPWKNPQTSGFQIIQSYLAFANGGIFGEGLGNSNEKLFYLPEAHNDFIFSVIGEELGLFGVLMAILLFVAMIYLGFKIALKMESRMSQILVSTVVFVVGLQALLNMGVVLGLLPTKGLNLPFISYGGSSIISNFFAIGLIISAFRQTRVILNNSALTTQDR
ncbi:MAG: cell division protein FtsW [Bdellovibrionales bacterium RIFOXYD12_FULL_39_22]|nr:MAG: cell division protein FtsW [Bdellovibrionales bacterium RIFOXYB1_FULL_39_21]OFZ42144.1 MAG: cell division protein FtsW [Bdellovibrionales bacterium RIFOXYC12_FULL_39_17]OFZ50965.1 MAG: cell division protein FtsW [Bdellovibrionales bacterium RIFOXYC1_FULL_39_130]OFZ78188.1 MAG: cell division protein FtsW [Bdellovibrionales bacterium RIFOXYD1_FULL_39_84]OFZ93824.1 MAG: cell division protein FtsW [Bdellovibrionales bacterium RIFOXYD12_FULL_39_22]